MPKTQGARVFPIDYKVRFTCPTCKHGWTSGLGQLAVILLLKRAPGGLLSVTFRVIAYWFECKVCGHRGDMKAYESEMERIAVTITKKTLKVFGFSYEKDEGAQKPSRPRSDHVKALCEACRLRICKYSKSKKGRKRNLEWLSLKQKLTKVVKLTKKMQTRYESVNLALFDLID